MKKKPTGPLQIRNSTAEFLIFTTQAGADGIEVRYEDETIWLTQKLMAALFDVDVRTVSEHLTNIFESTELREDSVIRKFRITASDGKAYLTQFYNLDAIISVGYRVNSLRATQFRQWATRVLREFAIKGYVLDKKRLENGAFLGEDYFERLLSEIREIRLSERKFYQKVTDIFGLVWFCWRIRERQCSHSYLVRRSWAFQVPFASRERAARHRRHSRRLRRRVAPAPRPACRDRKAEAGVDAEAFDGERENKD